MEIKNKKCENYLKGMTLIEMMVAISIFTIGIGGFTLLFHKTWEMNKFTLEMGQSSMAVSQSVNKMVSYIRKTRQSDNGSYALVSAANNDLVLYSDYNKDGVTERLHFYKNASDVLMGVTSPTNDVPKVYPEGDEQIITLASEIVNADDVPIFYYYDQSYSGATGQSSLSTPANISDVKLVKIYLQINIDPYNAPDNIQIQSFAELRNLKESN